MAKNDVLKVVLEKLDSLDKKLDEVRTKSIPDLHTAMEVHKVQLEERTGRRATIIAAIGGAITFALSVGASALSAFIK